MPPTHKIKRPKSALDPARLMPRDKFSGVLDKLTTIAQTKNTTYVSATEVIEQLLPQINAALANGHRLDEIFRVLQAEGVPLTRLMARDIRNRLNLPQPRQRKRPALRALSSPDAA